MVTYGLTTRMMTYLMIGNTGDTLVGVC